MNRLAYETAILSDISSEEEISLETLASSQAYAWEAEQRNVLGSVWGDDESPEQDSGPFLVNQEDTYYDGHIVRVELSRPTLANESYLILDILGPYWDRIFRCEFWGVSKITQENCSEQFQLAEIHKINIHNLGEGRFSCEFRTWVEGQYLRVEYRTSKVTRMVLMEGMSRETPPAN